MAVTRPVSQHGQIQAVGGVNKKVEAFFDACRSRELTGTQGVLIPRANVQHLILRPEVVTAVRDGRFHVYAIDTIHDATELVMGMAAGERAENGEFPPGSFNQLVELRLQEFAARRREYDSPRRAEETASAAPTGASGAHTVTTIPS